MAQDRLLAEIAGVSALAEPVRRALYLYVCAQESEVTRDRAAAAVDTSRSMAGFHLDRLVEEGLLEASFRRLTGRSGPGAGRPAKLYRRSAREVSVSLPHRRYDLAAEVLADAIERSLDGTPTNEAIVAASDAAAQRAVQETATAPHQRRAGELDRLATTLAPFGYEPKVEDDLVLANCPFDRLAGEHRELVCGMNLAFVCSVADRLGCSGVRAELDPMDGGCCVRVVPTD